MTIVTSTKTEADFTEVGNAYWAGLIDGEGCIRLATHKVAGKTYQYQTVKVAMTCEKTMMALANYFGCGSWGTRMGPKAHHLQQWWWQAASRDARFVMQKIRPYAITKAEAIDKCMALEIKEKYGSKLTAEIVRALRIDFFVNKLTREELVEKYSLSRSGVWHVLSRHSWKNTDLDLPTTDLVSGRPVGAQSARGHWRKHKTQGRIWVRGTDELSD